MDTPGVLGSRPVSPQTCSLCGAEVRFGWREEPTAPTPPAGFWMHREPQDHPVKLGRLMTSEDWAAIEAALDEPRLADDGTVYTTREYDHARERRAREKVEKKAREAAGDDYEAPEPIALPEPEVWALEIDRHDEHFPGGAKALANLMAKHEWRWFATYSRGPRVHASLGTLLGIGDYVILRMAALDDSNRRAVGFWCNNKFLRAWLATVDMENRRYNIVGSAKSDELKAWIRGEDVQ